MYGERDKQMIGLARDLSANLFVERSRRRDSLCVADQRCVCTVAERQLQKSVLRARWPEWTAEDVCVCVGGCGCVGVRVHLRLWSARLGLVPRSWEGCI